MLFVSQDGQKSGTVLDPHENDVGRNLGTVVFLHVHGEGPVGTGSRDWIDRLLGTQDNGVDQHCHDGVCKHFQQIIRLEILDDHGCSGQREDHKQSKELLLVQNRTALEEIDQGDDHIIDSHDIENDHKRSAHVGSFGRVMKYGFGTEVVDQESEAEKIRERKGCQKGRVTLRTMPGTGHVTDEDDIDRSGQDPEHEVYGTDSHPVSVTKIGVRDRGKMSSGKRIRKCGDEQTQQQCDVRGVDPAAVHLSE